jgi:hypothetical protein
MMVLFFKANLGIRTLWRLLKGDESPEKTGELPKDVVTIPEH